MNHGRVVQTTHLQQSLQLWVCGQSLQTSNRRVGRGQVEFRPERHHREAVEEVATDREGVPLG